MKIGCLEKLGKIISNEVRIQALWLKSPSPISANTMNRTAESVAAPQRSG